MLHACFYTICLVFRYTSWHFYAISRTNPLTRYHSVSSLFSTIFVFQKSYTGNILGIGRNKFRNSYFTRMKDEDQTGAGEGPEAGHTTGGAQPSPWPRPPIVRPPWSTSEDAPSPIRSLPTENPKSIGKISKKIPQLRRRHRQISGDRSLCSGTLPGWESAPKAISIGLHRRLHRLHRPCHHLHQPCCLL
jgi:hypothetical protein